jgi:hypothetical protein
MSFIDDLQTAWDQTARALGILSHADDLLHEVLPPEPDTIKIVDNAADETEKKEND